MHSVNTDDTVLELQLVLKRLLQSYLDFSNGSDQLWDAEEELSVREAKLLIETGPGALIESEFTLLRRIARSAKRYKRAYEKYRRESLALQTSDLSPEEQAEALMPLWEKVIQKQDALFLMVDEYISHKKS